MTWSVCSLSSPDHHDTFLYTGWPITPMHSRTVKPIKVCTKACVVPPTPFVYIGTVSTATSIVILVFSTKFLSICWSRRRTTSVHIITYDYNIIKISTELKPYHNIIYYMTINITFMWLVKRMRFLLDITVWILSKPSISPTINLDRSRRTFGTLY